MAYVEVGSGDPIVFLHGNPTSSYLWRNVIPHLETAGRCIAPDLIGMGDSAKLENSGPGSYRFADHARYLEALLGQLGVDRDVTLVGHDWGAALAVDWAARHPEAVHGIAYMEGVVVPMTWAVFHPAVAPFFRGFRSPAGEEMVLEQNLFVERILPGAILRRLSDEEMAVYRAPFAEPGESRRPTLTWPRQLPLDGEPADVVRRITANAEWLRDSPIPKLLVRAEPGAILVGNTLELCRGFSNQREVTVGGIHFIQEDSPDEIGGALRVWRDECVGATTREPGQRTT